MELDPADGGIGLKIGEHVSQQESGHNWFFSAGHTRQKGRADGPTELISQQHWSPSAAIGNAWEPSGGGANVTYTVSDQSQLVVNARGFF